MLVKEYTALNQKDHPRMGLYTRSRDKSPEVTGLEDVQIPNPDGNTPEEVDRL